jgi:hypothetical protein
MPAIPRDRFLDAMSRVAATVNVVTTDGPGGRAGVTVSAMTPVSADGAAPTLLICLHEDSRTTPAIAANRCFCINVLRHARRRRRIPRQSQDDQQVSRRSDYTVLASYGHVRDLPPKDGSVDPDERLRHDMGGRLRQQESTSRRSPTRSRTTPPDPRHRPRPRGRGDQLAPEGGAEEAQGDQEGHAGQPRGVQRDHQIGRDQAMEEPPRCRHGTGRGLSRAPRARLSRRLQPVAGAVAQAAGREIGGPRAVGLRCG